MAGKDHFFKEGMSTKKGFTSGTFFSLESSCFCAPLATPLSHFVGVNGAVGRMREGLDGRPVVGV